MRRREFIAGIGSAAAWPLVARAQQPAVPVIGYLSGSPLETYRESLEAFRGGLAETGYVEGLNVAIEYRSADDHYDQLAELASDLVCRRVAVIATLGNFPAVLAAKAATQTIPIVFLTGADPVANNLVASLARPGGNITGFAVIAGELLAKRLALLLELVPAAGTVAYILNPANFSEATLRAQAAAARSLGVNLLIVNASSPGDIERAFATVVQQQAGAVLVSPDTFFVTQRDQLVALAARNAIPTSYFRREFVEVGGLISYATDMLDSYRHAGVYVGRILRGEKPADLPVQLPTKFEMAVNLRTAEALGLTIPETLLATADEVIQ
jgi:putative tryptophan/tyrosine transport system substrate-binding protein